MRHCVFSSVVGYSCGFSLIVSFLLLKVTTRWQATEGSIWGLRICGSWEMTPCQDSTWMGWTTCASAWREDEPTGASNSVKAKDRDKLAVKHIPGWNDSCTVVAYVLYTALQAAAHTAVSITHSFPFYDILCNLLVHFFPSHPLYSHWLRPIQCMHKQLTACMFCVCLQPLLFTLHGLPFHTYIIECKGMCWLHPRIWTSKSSSLFIYIALSKTTVVDQSTAQ